MNLRYGISGGGYTIVIGTQNDMINFYKLVDKYCHDIDNICLINDRLFRKYIKLEDVDKTQKVMENIQEVFKNIMIDNIELTIEDSALNWNQKSLDLVYDKLFSKFADVVQMFKFFIEDCGIKNKILIRTKIASIPYGDWISELPLEVFENLTDSDEPLWMWDVDRLEKLMKAHNPIYKDAHYATYTLDNDAKEFYKHLYSGLILNDPNKMESLRDTVKEKYESDLTKIYQSTNNWAIKDLLIHVVEDSENKIFSEILTDALHSPNYWSKLVALKYKEGQSVYDTYFDNREISEEKVDKRVKEYIAQGSSTKTITTENKIEDISEEEVNKLFRLIHKEEIIPAIKGKEFIQQIKAKNIDIDKPLVWKYSFLDESKAALNLQWFHFRNRGYDLVDLSIDSFDNKLKKDIWKLTISKKEKHTLGSLDKANTKMYDFAFEQRIGEYIGVSLD